VVTTPDIRSAAPLRTCIGCRQQRPQPQLVRCVVSPQGATVSRTAAGRGAWLCSATCFHTAERRRAFDRAWKRTVPPQTLRSLEEQLRNAFDDVVTKMEELQADGVATDEPAATKG
jgi:predicted RNA-binding protein YlxR (DUF448 family)